MPHNRSAKKRLRQNVKRNVANKKMQSMLKTAVKKVEEALAGDLEAAKAEALLKAAFKRIDKAAKADVIHKNTASRKKSRLALKFAKRIKKAPVPAEGAVQQGAQPASPPPAQA